MAQLSLRGAFTALVTPFSEDGDRLDLPALEKLIEAQLRGGVAGLVPCGTTGETPTLTPAEQIEVIRTTKRVAAGRATVLAGAGTNSTRATVEAAQRALEAGADGVMVVMPYYNKPSQAGMKRHIETVAKAVSAPIVLYNIPGRTGVELDVATTLELVDSCPNVVGVKDATGGLFYSQRLLRVAENRVAVSSGDDALTLPMMAVGATGVISVTSNLLPGPVADLVRAALAGDYVTARARNAKLLPVHEALFTEPNPAPVKAALAIKGVCLASVRSPMVEASQACRERLVRVLRDFEGES